MKKLSVCLLLFLCGFFISAQGVFDSKKSNVKFSYGLKNLSYCNFYTYKIFNNTKIDENRTFLLKLKDSYGSSDFFDDKENYLNIKSQISFEWNNNVVSFIRYSKGNKEGEKEILTYHSSDSTPNYISESIQEILELKNDAFWEFYNSENNPNYPEVNKLKLFAKDKSGNINLEKLAKVIKENQAQLSKYLDN